MLNDSSANLTVPTKNVDPEDVRHLTNFEVFEFMRNRMISKTKVRAQQTLLYTGIKYFNEKSPCTDQNAEQIRSLTMDLKCFDFSKEEVLALINNCPTTQVELSVMISELDTRFNVAQIEEILRAVSQAFPKGTEKAAQINSSGVNEDEAE